MRDFRDAKAMAQTLRENLTTKAVTISHSESLELISRILGVADWNTLSAMLQVGRTSPRVPTIKLQTGISSYPAIPLRDLVPFPTTTYPLFVGREKTILALKDAFARQREVVLAIQKNETVDQPAFEDIYDIGVLAQLLEIQRLDDGTLRVLAQGRQRVVIQRFVGETGSYRVDVAGVSEGPIPDEPELIQRAVRRFESYISAHDIRVPPIWPPLERTLDPGRVADVIASHIVLPISEKQNLLATLDPVKRLKSADALIDLSTLPLSPALHATRRRAIEYADQRGHQYATLEHLLLALVDDTDAAAVLRDCNADFGTLKADLIRYLDKELNNLMIETGKNGQPTAAFVRVSQRAAVHAQELGWSEVRGSNTLMAILPETRSPAVRLLSGQGITQKLVATSITGNTGSA
ncbi:LON peptidase substrate-binding domain-containing protein [Tardiphaga sp. 42S5]|uniref:LON peptidase substrate-binding domain-containing protein n=1 Tax=Tardiphaga sp. 42S5 TaxID=1404799 RepID=UPI002A5A745B|nr:LON peptidase substrate-binding domain-containing protein [Tardiphaga sp. 42S5]WPO42944.1 LON peptidase substrate-binding domain-containing protein [Tardiphaga sp. 42S5]